MLDFSVQFLVILIFEIADLGPRISDVLVQFQLSISSIFLHKKVSHSSFLTLIHSLHSCYYS